VEYKEGSQIVCGREKGEKEFKAIACLVGKAGLKFGVEKQSDGGDGRGDWLRTIKLYVLDSTDGGTQRW